MACTSKVIRRYNRRDVLIGMAVRCEGACAGGGPCRTHDRGDPDPGAGLGDILRFCACPEDFPVPPPNAPTRANLVRGCRVALRMKRTPQGQLRPFDHCCIGTCEDTENKECVAVVVDTVRLANGDRQEILECRCVDKVEPVASVNRPREELAMATRRTARKAPAKRARRKARR